MNTQKTVESLNRLGLLGMSSAYEEIASRPTHELPGTHTAVAMLAEAEAIYKEQRRTSMYMKLSRLRYNVLPQQIECNNARNLDQDAFMTLCESNYIKKGENILITGPTGVGKSYLACSLGQQACMRGYKTMYLNITKFVETINRARLEGKFMKELNRINRYHLLIIEDFGIAQMEYNIKSALLHILEDRYRRAAVIITSQMPVNSWWDMIGEPTLADAIMDRLTSAAHKIDLKGNSMRKKKE